MAVNRAASLLAASASGERATGRQVWSLLWKSSRPLALRVAAWMGAGAVFPTVVIASDAAISLGTLLMTVSVIRRSRTTLFHRRGRFRALVAALATADRLFWLQDHAAAQATQAGAVQPPDRLRHGISLQDVTFGYPGTERAVLSGLTVTLAAGSTVALIGENGSGKTTLVKLLLGMYQPDQGRMEVDGTPLAELDPVTCPISCRTGCPPTSAPPLPAAPACSTGGTGLSGASGRSSPWARPCAPPIRC